ncbi:hypothetical protein KSD_20910 [Ktedonobacter sp. SOSP1-85]|uniref:helicase-associated domain-containing protein n=1 Tax=Ktedonobacter sp. SOSP1-85 TaxID=2778367 RepID=UPI00191591C7|nr:helicase-associated domain-containing protein [Ktedonobacter sp. SOSP1-85]GHO74320.1 hypothetical protein KSD_20910 [Ktedonobacter sp. SOSP1-85]
MKPRDVELLETIPLYHLHTLARSRQIPLTDATPEANVSADASASAELGEVARQLFDADVLSTLVRTLGEGEWLILRELVLCGGRANSRDLAFYCHSAGLLSTRQQAGEQPGEMGAVSAYGIENTHKPIAYPPAHPHGPFEQAIRSLLLEGLLFWSKQTSFAGREYSSGTHDGMLIVSPSVEAAVHEVAKERNLGAEPLLPAGPESGTDARMRLLQRWLYSYWSVVVEAREGLPLLNNGLLSRSALRSVLARMAEGEDDVVRNENESPRLLFLRLLAMKVGLLREQQGILQAAPAEAYFALPFYERARQCYQLAVEGSFWNEMAYLPAINVKPGPELLAEAHPEVVRSRQVVLERVLQETPGTWIDLPTFVARTRLYAPSLLFPRHQGSRMDRYSNECNPYGWDFRLQRGWLTHREGWYLVEGGFIRAVIEGVLSWLGIVEVDAREHPDAFRLLPAGRALFHADEQALEQPEGRLIVQPNFELVAMAPVSESLLLALDRFAEREQLEYVAHYRLTRASVTRAIQRGYLIEDVLRTLEVAADGALPQNVRYTLLEWERQARRVEIWREATLMEVADSALLDALLGEQETSSLFGRRLSSTLVEVAPGKLAEAQQVLWEREQLPAVTRAGTPRREDGEERHEPQWRLREDGLLQPLYGVLNFYLVRVAERFCAYDEARGGLCLTESSVRAALKQHMTLDEIMDFLRRYCIDDIPGSLVLRLKLWGNGYEGQRHIGVARAPLLILPEQILNDLEADEEIHNFLQEAIAPEQRLVRVSEQHLERVLRLLRERGFTTD